jgi:hypothetical protein
MLLAWVSWAFVGMAIAWAVGQATRDRYLITAWLFYIPSPLVALGGLSAFGVAVRRRDWKWATCFLLLMLGPLYFVVGVENRFVNRDKPRSTGDNSATLRVVHWNVYHGRLGWSVVRSLFEEKEADLILFSEAPHHISPDEFPDHHVIRDGALAAISRFPVSNVRDLSVGDRLLFAFTWELPSQDMNVLLADHPSSLRIHRDPLLKALLTDMLANDADIVFGDLNAPRRSLALSALPNGYRHAYDVCGRGWSYSWPSPLTAFAIDHCICGPRVEPISYVLDSTLVSDHRIQVLDLRVASPSGAEE